MTAPAATSAMPGVLEALDAETERLSDAAAAAIFAELDGYRQVPREAIQRSMRANVQRAVSTLRTGRPPAAATRAEAAAITLERAEQGVPIDDIMRAYRLSLRLIHERFLELATGAGIAPAVILDCSNLLWEVGDWFIASAASVFRDHQLELTVRKSLRRTELLRDVLGGMLTKAELQAAATALEIDGSQEFRVFCVPDADAVDALTLAVTHPGGVAEIAGRLFGLAVEGSALRIPGVAVAVGPPRVLTSLQESTRIASRIAELILDDAPGLYGVGDFPWTLAAHAEPEVLASLRRTYVAPLESRGPFGASLIASVREYLACDLNIATASQRLVVHPNTLRYRLAKYEDIVGAQLTTTRAIAELAMALDLRLPSHAPTGDDAARL